MEHRQERNGVTLLVEAACPEPAWCSVLPVAAAPLGSVLLLS